MLVAIGENYTLEKYDLQPNSKYEYNTFPSLSFKGKPVGKKDIKRYRIQQGVEGSTDSVYVQATNLPDEVKSGDRIKFMGKYWTVESIGVFIDTSLIINASLFNDDYIIKRSPKGLALN